MIKKAQAAIDRTAKKALELQCLGAHESCSSAAYEVS
jgi:hypothetical protein